MDGLLPPPALRLAETLLWLYKRVTHVVARCTHESGPADTRFPLGGAEETPSGPELTPGPCEDSYRTAVKGTHKRRSPTENPPLLTTMLESSLQATVPQGPGAIHTGTLAAVPSMLIKGC